MPTIQTHKPVKPRDGAKWTVFTDASAPVGGKSSEASTAFAVFADDKLYYLGGVHLAGSYSASKAEAKGVFNALHWCFLKGITEFTLYSDDRGLVDQLNNIHTPKNDDRILTFGSIRHTESFLRVTYEWTPRETPQISLCDYICRLAAQRAVDVQYKTALEHNLILGAFYTVKDEGLMR
jgi:ribonuclease HI